MRVAVLDLGANTFHLLVAEVARDGSLTVLADAKEMVRLGDTSFSSGTLTDEVRTKAVAACGVLLERAALFPGARLVVVATSAIREAKNGAALLDDILRAFGVRTELLPGEEEARLVYRGARSATMSARSPLVVLDVGGGSVQVAVGEGERILLARSLPLGGLRLRQEILGPDGVLRARDAAAIAGEVLATTRQLAGEVASLSPQAFALTGGAPKALAKLAAWLPGRAQDPEVLTGHWLASLGSWLIGRPPSHLEVLGVERGRLDTLATSAVAVTTLLALFGAKEAHVSRRGLREGVLLREARQQRASFPSATATG